MGRVRKGRDGMGGGRSPPARAKEKSGEEGGEEEDEGETGERAWSQIQLGGKVVPLEKGRKRRKGKLASERRHASHESISNAKEHKSLIRETHQFFSI